MARKVLFNIRAMKHVYDVTVSGRYTILATVTNHPDAITEWINGVKADGRNTVDRKVGFEIELHYNRPPIGTVQLCVGRRCLVIRLVPDVSPFPPSFSEFLGDSNNIFVGFEIEDKMKMLRQQVPIGVEHIGTMDVTKDAPQLVENKKKILIEYGLATVENDWGHKHPMLSDKQVKYACIDASINLEAAIGIAQRRHIKKPAAS